MALCTYKLVIGGSVCEEIRKALGVGVWSTARLTITNAGSSIGAKTGLMGMPLSLYAVARSIGIPLTQIIRVVVLKVPVSKKMVLQGTLVFLGLLICFQAADEIQGV